MRAAVVASVSASQRTTTYYSHHLDFDFDFHDLSLFSISGGQGLWIEGSTATIGLLSGGRPEPHTESSSWMAGTKDPLQTPFKQQHIEAIEANKAK